jgi:hypothetical protein
MREQAASGVVDCVAEEGLAASLSEWNGQVRAR